MLNEEELYELFNTEFPEDMTFSDINEKLNNYTKVEKVELQKVFCDILCSTFSEGFFEYAGVNMITDNSLIRLFIENVKELDDNSFIFKAIYFALLRDEHNCLRNIKKAVLPLGDSLYKHSDTYCEADFCTTFLVPIKNLIPGLWTEVGKIIKKYPCEPGLIELLELLDIFYAEKDLLKRTLLLQEFTIKYPDLTIPKEFLAVLFIEQKMWHNAIASFEQIDDKPLYYSEECYFDLIALCYSKIKDLNHEEKYARKVYEINPDKLYAKNNLAYCLLKRKKYAEAKKLLEICVENNLDMPYAANNYVRVLIALGQGKTAREFIISKKYKIDKSLVNRVKKLTRYDKQLPSNDTSFADDEENTSIAVNKIIAPLDEQFSNEKLLEDELTMRIEKGYPVFGKLLKIYKRKGVYGRQFVISNGKRLDLLCEDENGDLYIIELKKDSGYDDAYEQTAGYLNWFETNEISKGKKVYGIICLNNPTTTLIDKVHKDHRMKIYEYQISYIER